VHRPYSSLLAGQVTLAVCEALGVSAIRVVITALLVTGLLVAGALAPGALATTYIVAPDGSGDFPSIQAAINAATGGDTILLTDGTFVGAGNRDLNYQGKGITIASQSGNPAACILNALGSESETRRGVYFHANDGPDAVLQGITIQGGYAPGGYIDVGGGAILCDDGAPTILDCVFFDNHTGRYGGAARFNNSTATLRRCVFTGNSAVGVGASGGAICATDFGTVTLEDCVFQQNEAWIAGGFYLLQHAAAVFTRCRFEGNIASASGGAVGSSNVPSAVFTECAFFDNVCNAEGGGISWSGDINGGSSLTLERCTFARNTTPGYGGAIYAVLPARVLDVRNCTFHAHAGGMAGAIYSHANDVLNRFTNTIISASPSGASAYLWGPAEIACCDFHGNAGGDWTGALAPFYGVNGNISEDPRYCGAELDDFTLYSDSPCAPFTPPNPECDLIGAWPVGCDATPVVPITWGGIKHRFAGIR
jgi:predicted outer membrane repeat protein